MWPPLSETLIGSKWSVSSAGFRPKGQRFFLPVSWKRPFSSGTTATESAKKRWKSALPSFSAVVLETSPSGAILRRKSLMMPVRVVSWVLPSVGADCCTGRAGCTFCTGCTGWAGRTGAAGAAAGWASGTDCTGRWGVAARGVSVVRRGAGAGMEAGAEVAPALRIISSKSSGPLKSEKAIWLSWVGVFCSGVVEMPTLRKISST